MEVFQRRPQIFTDKTLLIVTAALVSLSLLMIYSTTAVQSVVRYGDSLYYLRKQLIASLLGLILLVVAASVNIEKIRAYANWLLLLGVVLLLGVLIPGVGLRAGGAQRWINLGVVIFQPVEMVKLLTIIFMASYLSKNERRLKEFIPGVLVPLLILFVVAGLLILQPDFGSGVVIVAVCISMMLAAGVRLRYFIGAGLLLVSLASVLVIFSPYRMSRVLSFLSPFSDAAGKGYQLIQSLVAVGTGGIFGVGLGASQQKLYFLPAAHTDFIFAVIAEEFGFLGSLCIVLLFLIFLWRGVKIATLAVHDTFYFVLALGLTLLIVLPALLNICVVLGLLPTKGLALPFMSYGGTSLAVSLAVVGLLIGIARRNQQRLG